MSARNLFDLTGKVALITGGSRGLGLQMAKALGDMGARVAISARKADELAEAKTQLTARGIDVLTVTNDLGRPEGIPALVDGVVAHFGTIDILVNNAGATWGAPAEDTPLEAWDKVMNLNIRSIFLMSQAVGKASMIPRRQGRIINIASIAGLSGSWIVLSTRTTHWFIERGFAEADISRLPGRKQSLYNYERRSKIFMKGL